MQSTISNLANYLSKTLNQSDEQYQVNVAILKIWTHTLISVIATFSLAYLIGILKYVIIISLVGFVLRSFSGGWHSKSPITCTMLSVIYINSTALLINSINISTQFTAILTSSIILIGFYLIYKYAPADTPQKPIISPVFRQQLRNKSYIFLLTLLFTVNISYFIYDGYIWLALSILSGIMWQLFSITPLGYRLLGKLDYIIDRMKGC